MKKVLFGILGILGCSTAMADIVPWWLQPTICKPNTSRCYATTGAGFDADMWDMASSCRGMKLVCETALTGSFATSQPLSKTTIVAGTGINSDFDTNTLGMSGDCFGARKSSSSGSQVLVGGQLTKVWCRNILISPDEEVANGEITFGTEPTCDALAVDGFVAMLNQGCYGKYFDPAQYFIECAAGQLLPARIVALNGAAPFVGLSSQSVAYPTALSDANTLFQQMQTDAAVRRKSHFGP